MRIGGVWVGWGLGDISKTDFTVQRAKKFMRAMYHSYAGNLADTNVFDQQMASTVFEMQTRLVENGRLIQGKFFWGILDLLTQEAMGFKKPPAQPLPILFTVEGHLSNMFFGPCAFTAQTLEAQGVCHVKPISYNNGKLPFDNDSGIRELVNQLSRDQIEGPPGILWPFPVGTNWGIIVFSQGGIIGSEFLMRYILKGQLNWRLKDCKRSLAFGNPYRELNQIADWVPDPPRVGTQGISDVRLNVAGTEFGKIHREHARHGDIYAENEVSEEGQKKTAVYKAVQGKFTGAGSLLNESIEIFMQPQSQIFPVVQAIWSGGMFIFNMGPHGTYDLNPCIEWMRGVKG